MEAGLVVPDFLRLGVHQTNVEITQNLGWIILGTVVGLEVGDDLGFGNLVGVADNWDGFEGKQEDIGYNLVDPVPVDMVQVHG